MSQSESLQGASSGVEALLERLRGEGVEQGREEAELAGFVETGGLHMVDDQLE